MPYFYRAIGIKSGSDCSGLFGGCISSPSWCYKVNRIGHVYPPTLPSQLPTAFCGLSEFDVEGCAVINEISRFVRYCWRAKPAMRLYASLGLPSRAPIEVCLQGEERDE